MKSQAHWVSQLEHFKTALALLTQGVALKKKRAMNDAEMLGIILCFKQNCMLAWLCLKQCFENQGEIFLNSEKEIIRLAFRRGLISDGETWMDMLKNIARIKETYKKDFASRFFEKILDSYYPVFQELKNILEERKLKEQ